MAAAPHFEKTEVVKEFVGSFARSDAKHDFGDIITGHEAENINKGLSDVIQTNFLNEHACFESVVKHENWAEVSHKTTVGIKVGYEAPANNNYNLTRLELDRITDGREFRDACGLKFGGALIVDFNQNGFLNKLAGENDDNCIGGEKPIYVITNPQTINDAAPKLKFNDPIFRDVPNAPLVSLIDKTQQPVIFSAWDNKNKHINNMFLTSYQHEISPIIEVHSGCGKLLKLTTNVTVNNMNGKITKSVIKDSKINNSKFEILKKIQSIFNKFLSRNFEINEGLQRKRLGDWGQAISCFTLNNKKYYKKDLTTLALPLTFIKQPDGEDPGIKENAIDVYFVTHDYIAAAFALFLGANVFFLLNGNVYIFKKNVQSIPYHEHMRNQITDADGTPGPIKKELENLIKYNNKRQETLAMFKQFIAEHIHNLNKAMSAGGLKDSDNIKDKCLDLLKRAYIYNQIKQTTPDPSELIAFLSMHEDSIVPDVVGAINRRKVTELYESYCKAKDINNKYTPISLAENQIQGIKNSFIYLTIVHWTYTKTPLVKKSTRLGIDAGGIISNQDKYAFLPFLSSLDNLMKTEIVDVFRELYKKINDDENNKFFQGYQKGTTYQYAILSFKILCESICIFLAPTQVPEDKNRFNELSANKVTLNDDVNGNKTQEISPLSLKEIIEENKIANYEKERITDQSVEDANNADKVELRRSERLRLKAAPPKEKSKLQRGGLYAGNRILNTNSLKEMTHVLLASHLILNSDVLQRNFVLLQGGGGENYQQGDIISPYLPIYIALEGLRQCVNKLENHPDYKYYINYFVLLYSMCDALDVISSPIIGILLKEILITYISTSEGRGTIEGKLLPITNDWFSMFALITTTVTSHICGSFVDYDTKQENTMMLANQVINVPVGTEYLNAVFNTYAYKHNNYSKKLTDLNYFKDQVNVLQSLVEQKMGVSLQYSEFETSVKYATPSPKDANNAPFGINTLWSQSNNDISLPYLQGLQHELPKQMLINKTKLNYSKYMRSQPSRKLYMPAHMPAHMPGRYTMVGANRTLKTRIKHIRKTKRKQRKCRKTIKHRNY